MPFIKGTIEPDILQAFIAHIRSCPSCYDELETFYAIHHTLDALDSGRDADYHIRDSLQKELEEKEKELVRDIRLRRAGRILLVLILISALLLAALIFAPGYIRVFLSFFAGLFSAGGAG